MQVDKGRHSTLFLERSDATPLNGVFAESVPQPIERERQPMRALMWHEGREPFIFKQPELGSPLVCWRF